VNYFEKIMEGLNFSELMMNKYKIVFIIWKNEVQNRVLRLEFPILNSLNSI
jgi:hypothetical protein